MDNIVLPAVQYPPNVDEYITLLQKALEELAVLLPGLSPIQ
jgi:hypothetical protein